MTAVTVYSLAGFSGLGGRLLLGALADRLGAKHVLVGGLFVQALSVATYLAVGQLGEFYALSVVFGLAYGGVMPLYAVLVREYFGARIMGTVFGAVSAFASLGMALGPLAGGWVFDTFHAYNWLYVGSFAIGIAAVAVALSFPSAKRPSQPSLLDLRLDGAAAIEQENARKRMNKPPGIDLVERARALAPLIAREADEIERTRRLTPAVTQALIENGLYRALLPQSLGGAEAAARNVHADAGGNRQGRCLHRVVPRPVQRLRHDRGLSRS